MTTDKGKDVFEIKELSPAMLDEMSSIAKLSLCYDTISTELINEKTFAAQDYKPSLLLGCFCNNSLAGFIVGATRAPQVAWIRLLVVHPEYTNRGIATLLLKALETAFSEKGITTVSVGDCPENYLMPGMDYRYTAGWCFLKKNGYSLVHSNQNLVAPISVSLWPFLDEQIKQLSSLGITIRRAVPGDMESIITLLNQCWVGWVPEVENTFSNSPISTFIAMDQQGSCVGFSSYQGNNKSLPWFGPMGTLPTARGKGIGGCLFRLCLKEMAKQGFNNVIIPWVGPVRFYVNYSDAKIDRVFYVFRKTF